MYSPLEIIRVGTGDGKSVPSSARARFGDLVARRATRDRFPDPPSSFQFLRVAMGEFSLRISTCLEVHEIRSFDMIVVDLCTGRKHSQKLRF